ncbi:MAG: phage portal protein [Gammaproteobacteria bacterium]|nr:MAG: phage portal protein [Gammaproteobacteria bacterium]
MALLDIFKKSPVAAEEEVVRQEPTIGAPAVQNQTLTLNNIEELSDALGIVNSMAGPVVNSTTAMRLAIVYACTRMIAGAMAGMPLHIYRNAANGRERDTGHPLAPLLNLQPTPLMSAAMFWEYISASMLLQGDGFAVIMRNEFGEPVEFLPVSPTHTHVEKKGGRLLYFFWLDDQWRGFDQDDVLHFAGFGFNGTRSLSVIKHAAVNSIGLAMAMEQFSSEFFKNGAHIDFAVVKDGKWDTQDMQNFREAWQRHYGGLSNGRPPLTIGKGLDIKQLQVNAEDSQLLGSREFENINICTAFGIPGFMVNQGTKVTAWGTGMAEMGLAFVRYTLSPHIVRFEQEMNRKLFMRGDSFVEFNSAGLMRGTLKERNEAYRTALGGSNVPGYMAINEVRRIENMPPLANPIYDQPYDPRLVTTQPAKDQNDAQ